MNQPQAGPTSPLLARKGHAAPVDAVSDAAKAFAPVLDSESLPESGALTRPGTRPAASLLPIDFLAGRQIARDVALRPPDRSEVAVDPLVADEPIAARAGSALPELAAKPDIPRPDPTLRIESAAKPAVRTESWRLPALVAGLALLLGAAGTGYQSGWFESEPQSLAPAAQAPAAQAPTVAPPKSSLAAPSAVESDLGTDRPIVAGQASVDIVRIAPDGAAVIAGRAAPGAELILLDNGEPIGTVAADAYGEWVFIPAEPLPGGAHDFGLVLKKIEGGASVPSLEKVPSVPGVSALNEPSTVAGAAAAVPIPPRKPDAGLSPAFMVQLASLKTRAGAEREWRTLRRRFPDILSALSLSFDEAKLAGGDRVVRLRIGAFAKQTDAAALCARLAFRHQDCLVVRSAAGR